MLSPRAVQFSAWFSAALGAVFLAWLLRHGLLMGAAPYRDFFDFFDASLAARAGTDIYTSGDNGYIYPPLLAVLLVPLTRLEPKTAAHLWSVFLLVLLVRSAYLCAAEGAWRAGIRIFRLDTFALASASVILLGITWKSEFEWGNCDLLVVLPIITALLLLDKRPGAAGLCLAFALNIKYIPLVFLPYLLVRGRWRAAGAMIFGAIGFALLPAMYLGWERNLAYLRAALLGLQKMAGGGADGPAANINPLASGYSLSIPSSAARLAERFSLPPSTVVIATASIAAAMFIGGWVLYRAHRQSLFAGRTARADDASRSARLLVALEWSGLLTAALLFSPQTIHRHLNILLPVCSLALALLLRARGQSRWLLVAGLLVLTVGATSIPGLPGWRGGIEEWTAIGGRSLCLAAMYFTMLYAGLRRAAELGDEDQASSVGNAAATMS